MSYKVALVEKKDPINLLEAYNQALKICLKTLDEIKGFKYQITVKALLRKDKQNGEIEFAPVYFSSTTKTVINHKFDLDKSFQWILYRTDNWISERSGWIIESINSQYINISTYTPLIWSSYMKLHVELRNPKKGLINVYNNDQKCFLWCHIRHINSVKIYPERITQKDKQVVNDLNYREIKFSVSEKKLIKLKRKITFALMFFVMKMY